MIIAPSSLGKNPTILTLNIEYLSSVGIRYSNPSNNSGYVLLKASMFTIPDALSTN